MSYIVALTGGIGSGKSTVANVFSSLGVSVVDADVIARQVVQPGTFALRTLVRRFGLSLLFSDGTLNRAFLRQQIFSSPTDKAWVNGLLHPLIHYLTEKKIYFSSGVYILWVVPLLIENTLQHCADRILVVDVPPEIQMERSLIRDGVSCAQLKNILSTQVSRHKRLAFSDDVLDNTGGIAKVIDRVSILHQRYLRLGRSLIQQDVTL